MEQNKECNDFSLFFKFTAQDFKDEAISCNENLRKTQVLFFQGLNEIQDDYNKFEHLLDHLVDHVDKMKKADSTYE